MGLEELDDTARRFVETLYDLTRGDTAAQVSMYDIGSGMGLDREASSAVAQELMGKGLIEIRTLSGGIGISQDGASLFVTETDPDPSAQGRLTLGDDPILDLRGAEAVERLLSEVKYAIGKLGIPFDQLTDLMADIRTVEAQLTSSQPKTGVIKECLSTLREIEKPALQGDLKASIDALIDG